MKNHLQCMSTVANLDDVHLCDGDEKPVFLHSQNQIKQLAFKKVGKCGDCPHPCV